METKNLQIVIDLKDLYTEYGGYDYETGCSEPNKDGDFNSVLKSEIQSRVIEHIIKGFTPEITKKLKEETIAKFNDQFEAKISERIIKSIERGIFTDKNGKTFKVDAYVQERFELAVTNNRTFMERIDRGIKEQIEQMQKTLQQRYDMQFAAGIIKNLKDGGLLKEGAEKLLIQE
ncbi:hypothetical protein A2Z56_02550 [Candidatus Kaiserbacteria bacterium RIFCSPHIGHO2_12_45_16]|nr:MAG: hypothetical protein A2Z56_02550 [Candidatus Kaiserbacteria bacterium RIFCSPHIGHO2_12_45_16]